LYIIVKVATVMAGMDLRRVLVIAKGERQGYRCASLRDGADREKTIELNGRAVIKHLNADPLGYAGFIALGHYAERRGEITLTAY
jgi:hypothetical protein